MKTQLLAAALVASVVTLSTNNSDASDLSYSFASLQSARQMYTPTAKARQQAALTRQQVAEPAAPKLILGAYLVDVEGGLQVTGTVPGSPASESLKPGDILRRVSAMGRPVRTLNTMTQFDYAKQEIGADHQAVLEIFRPGTGTEYVWVTFRPDGDFARFTRNAQQADARSLFKN